MSGPADPRLIVAVLCFLLAGCFIALLVWVLKRDDAPLSRDDQATLDLFEQITAEQLGHHHLPLVPPAGSGTHPPAGDAPGPASASLPPTGGTDANAAATAPGPGARPPWETRCHQPAAPTSDMWGDDLTGHLDYQRPVGDFTQVIAAMDGAP